jgi:cell division protein FtsQ
MSAATIKRGTKRPTRATVKRKGARTASAKRISPFKKLMDQLGIQAETVERWTTYTMVGMVGVAAIGVAILAGLPGYVGTQIGMGIGRAGFEVKRVEVKGIDRMERLTVYAIALDQVSMAMPLVDLEKVRGQLMRYGWIADARVSRRLPDTLVVDIVERKPAAIWQHRQKLSLIDSEGVILEKVAVNAMPDLPLVIGKNANARAGELNALLDNTPSLKPVLAGATWVGNRRWDLRFQSGETLALPEGQDVAALALTKFARMDGTQRLLGRGFVRFDMRDPAKMFVRGAPKQQTVEDAAKASDAT